MYKVYTVSTSTWRDLALVDPAACAWKRTYNGSAGGLQSTFKLSDSAVRATSTSGALTPVERCILVEHDGVLMYGGIIWEDDYDRDTKTLSVSHEDIWSLMALRLIAEDRTGNIPAWVKTYTGMEYDTIVKRLVQLGTTGAGRTIPINYEDDYTGGRARTYNGYNLETVDQAITEIMNLPIGPYIDFRPEWNDERDGIRWTLRTGDMNPDAQTIEANLSADDSAVRGLKQKRSGRERATRVMGVGEGSGKDIKVRAAAGAGSLVLERVEQAKNIKTLTDLQEFADGELSPRNSLITQYSMDLNITKPNIQNLWALKPGAFLRWNLNGDPMIPAGWRTQKIMEYSGDIASNWVHLEVQ